MNSKSVKCSVNCCPAGAFENSPVIHRWAQVYSKPESSVGTAAINLAQPSRWDSTLHPQFPSDESLGYFRLCLTGQQIMILFACLLLYFAAAGAQTPQQAESKSNADNKRGSITGKVLADDGQPLVGVGVYLSRATGERSISRPAATDEEGNFKVNDLPTGSYRVNAQVNGYVPSSRATLTQRYRVGEAATITLVKGGAITGKVYDSAGQPLVGATVNAQRVRDDAGRSVGGAGLRDAMSDDRGVYRIYGLETGSYIVFTNGGYGAYYDDGIKEAPTYHPASTRDTAQEVSVTTGAAVTGIDIRHRGERGLAVSGFFSGLYEAKSDNGAGLNVQLTHATTGAAVAQVYVNPRSTGKNTFALYGLADGEYELSARRQNFSRISGEGSAASATRKLSVQGSDVTGLELKLLPLASIRGRIVLEPNDKKDCPITQRSVLAEINLTYQRDSGRDEADTRTMGNSETAPDEKSEFAWQDLLAGRYRLAAQLPSDHWYLKALTVAAKPTAAKTPAAKPLDVARQGLDVKAGEKLTGLTVTIAQGAAELRGRVTSQSLPARLRVHLVPAEKESADDVLRYAEVITRDGAFTFTNLAPGKYWLLPRPIPADEPDEKPAQPVAWDAEARAKLRQAAEAATNAITLTICQRVKDHTLVFSSTVEK